MELSKNAQKVFDLVKELTAIELASLVKALEEEFGVTAASMVVAGAATGGDEAASADSDSMSIELTAAGAGKIGVIKVVKELLGLGLKEAKDLVDQAPVVIKENAKSEEAEAIKAKLEEAGATVSFK